MTEKQAQRFISLLLGAVIVPVLICSPVAADEELQKNFLQGQKAYEAGDYQKAIDSYEKVVEIDPNFAPVFNALGLAYQGLNAQISDIIWFYKVATDIDPKYVDAYTNTCRAYYEAEDGDSAVIACQKAIQMAPSNASARLTLAWTYLRLKQQPNEAIHYFEEVLKVTQAPAIYFGLGMAYVMRGDTAQTLEIITKIRTMGHEEFAAQLESLIRTAYAPVQQPSAPAMQEPVALPQRQAGTLISSMPTASVPTGNASDEATPISSDGLMHVRLRGKLTSTSTAEQISPGPAAQVPAPQADHPSSLSDTTSAPSEESAIDRIRQLRRFRGTSKAQPRY